MMPNMGIHYLNPSITGFNIRKPPTFTVKFPLTQNGKTEHIWLQVAGIKDGAYAERDGVALISRNGIDKAQSFPEIVDALTALRKRAKRPFVLDGEIVIMRDGSPTRFQDLQSRMHVIDRAAIASHRTQTPAALMVFDLLMDGKNTIVAEPQRLIETADANGLFVQGRADCEAG